MEFVEQHKDVIKGFIGCYDRIRLKGRLHDFSYTGAMEHYLYKAGVKLFDSPSHWKPITQRYKSYVETLAAESGVEVDYVSSYRVNKEERVQEVLSKRGHAPGLVHIISVVEGSPYYNPHYNQDTQRAELVYRQGKCLQYYFYFIDEAIGLCFIRVSTWAPFGIQFYSNGHHHLFRQLDKKGIRYQSRDNALLDIDNIKRAQRICDKFSSELLLSRIEKHIHRYVPLISWLEQTVHWTIDQAEYSTDILFKNKQALSPIYDNLIKQAIHIVKPENVYTFLGKKLTGNYQGELGNDFKVRQYGSRIKHYSRDASIKMYDKYGCILRIETTVNNIKFFSHRRIVEKRDGSQVEEVSPMRKSIHSLQPLRATLFNCNKRYLEFIAVLDDPTTGQKNLNKITSTVKENDRSYRGLNFFNQDDLQLINVINKAEYCIAGISNKDIRLYLNKKSTYQVSRLLKSLRLHGIIRKIPNKYRYHVTQLGRAVINAGIEIAELILPASLDAKIS